MELTGEIQQINKPVEFQQTQTNEIQYISQKSESFFDIRERLNQIFENFLSPTRTLSLEDEINNKFLNLDFGAEFDINADKIGVNDAIFFVNLLNQQNLINYSVEDNKIELTTCFNLIESPYK